MMKQKLEDYEQKRDVSIGKTKYSHRNLLFGTTHENKPYGQPFSRALLR